MRNPFIVPPIHPQDALFTRWRVPFLAKGAIGQNGGHWKVLGLQFRWNRNMPPGWSEDSALSFWGLVAIVRHNDRGGTLKRCAPPWEIKFVRLDLKAAIRWASCY